MTDIKQEIKSAHGAMGIFFRDVREYFTGGVFSGDGTAQERRAAGLLLGFSAILFLLRLINLYTYPSEFMWDEIKDISYAVFRYTGKVGFFYSDFDFAPNNLHHQIMSLFTGLIKENIRYYKLFGVVYNAVFIAGLYLLAKKMFGRTTAAFAVLIACVSYTGYFNTRLNLCNMLVPLFMVYCLYFLLQAIDGKKTYLIPYFACFILGCNTYYNWMLIIPVIIWIIADGCLTGRIKSRGFALLIVSTAVLAGVLYTAYFWKAFMFRWTEENALGRPAAGSVLLAQLENFKYLFFSGHPRADHFMTDLPFINFQESLLLVSGLFIAVMCIKRPEYRLLVVSFVIFISAVIVVPTTHQMRMVQAAIPISILAALPLGYVFRKNERTGYLLAALLAALYAGFITHYFSDWQSQLVRNDTNKQFAEYMNGAYGEKIAYFEDLDFEVPLYTVLRMKAYYSKAEKKYGAFKMNVFWLKNFMPFAAKYFPEDAKSLDIKIFSGHDRGRYLFALLCFPLDSKLGGYLSGCEAVFKKYYDSKFGFPIETELSGDGKNIFRNTLIKEILAVHAASNGKMDEALRYYGRTDFPFWFPADFHNKVSKLLSSEGRQQEADSQRAVYTAERDKLFENPGRYGGVFIGKK